MHRIIIIMALAVASLLSIDACAQTGLNVAPFFSEEYASEKKLTSLSYRGGDLYFGLYSMGGKGAGRRYLIFLNRRPAGQEKTILVYIEGNISEETVKKLIKR